MTRSAKGKRKAADKEPSRMKPGVRPGERSTFMENNMALTSVAHNSTGTLNHTGQQKAAEQTNGKEKAARPSEENIATKRGDTVTLSQSEKVAAGEVALDEQQVAEMLPNAKEAILKNSKAALASQANVNAQVAREILAES